MNTLFLLTLLGVIMGFLIQQNRVVTVYISILMWVITGWQYNTADYYNYYMVFQEPIGTFSLSPFGQPIYYLINVIVKKTCGDFQMVYILCGLIAIITLVLGIKMYTNRVNLVLSLFAVSAFLIYAVQIRNFVAMSFIIVAVRYIFEDKKNIKKFIIFVLIASGFHVTSLFYLILLLIPYLNKTETFLVAAALCAGAYCSERVLSFIMTSLGMLDYTRSTHNLFTIIIYTLFSGTILVAIIYLCNLMQKNKDYYFALNQEWEIKTIEFSKTIKRVAILMFICIPLQFVSIEAVRLCRNLFPLFFCVVARLYPQNRRINVRSIKPLEIHIGIIIIAMILYCFLYGDLYVYRQCYETVFLPLFKDNCFLLGI